MKINYYCRIIQAYCGSRTSQLTFWHDDPQMNPDAFCGDTGKIGVYYMIFFEKACYKGSFDEDGIPLLDYKGSIGLQYNPIAISQYGLGNFNLFKKEHKDEFLAKAQKSADWLINNLEKNRFGLYVWNHRFDWEYHKLLRAPWYSALAQGQGISLLARIYNETKDAVYKDAMTNAFKSFLTESREGGVLFLDNNNDYWLEEYILNPPTHILNGFIWALWGVYDYFLLTRDDSAQQLWQKCLKTLCANLDRFDCGYWSLYDLSETRIKNIASPFYHRLHIVQLGILYRLSGASIFQEYKDKWAGYSQSVFNRMRAYCKKAAFKLFYF